MSAAVDCFLICGNSVISRRHLRCAPVQTQSVSEQADSVSAGMTGMSHAFLTASVHCADGYKRQILLLILEIFYRAFLEQ